MIVLEQLPQEDDIPCDVLVHILSLYNRAAKGLSFSVSRLSAYMRSVRFQTVEFEQFLKNKTSFYVIRKDGQRFFIKRVFWTIMLRTVLVCC